MNGEGGYVAALFVEHTGMKAWEARFPGIDERRDFIDGDEIRLCVRWSACS